MNEEILNNTDEQNEGEIFETKSEKEVVTEKATTEAETVDEIIPEAETMTEAETTLEMETATETDAVPETEDVIETTPEAEFDWNDVEEKERIEDSPVTFREDIFERNIRVANFDDVLKNTDFPSVNAVINCWDKDLIERMIFAVAKESDADVLISPKTTLKTWAYSEGLTEDPRLCRGFVDAYLSGVKRACRMPVIRCGFDCADVSAMDVQFSERAFYEYHMNAYVGIKDNAAFCFPYRRFEGEYEEINTRGVNQFLHNDIKANYVFCERVPKALEEDCVQTGNLPIDGENLSALREKSQKAIQFNEEVKRLRAQTPQNASEGLALEVTERSCVCLKNENILPLKTKDKKIAVFGGFGNSFQAESVAALLSQTEGLSVDWRRGYTSDISADYAADAELAEGADYSIVLLGFTEEEGKLSRKNKNTTLPALQEKFLQELKNRTENIIAVVASENMIDLSFAEGLKAVLLCPSTGAYCDKALARVLTGESTPAGRLANTYYTDTENHFRMLRHAVQSGQRKVGTLVGYREYTTSGEIVEYPFGFGLSYSRFKYTKLKIENQTLSFHLKNCGKKADTETVQFYYGKCDSAIVRPKRELKAYLPVRLGAKSSKKFTCELPDAISTVYVKGEFLTEEGEYAVGVGRSCSDLCLTDKTMQKGKKFAKSNGSISEYIPVSSNVLKSGHTLQEVKKRKSTGSTLIRIGLTVFLALILCLVAYLRLDNVGYIELEFWNAAAISLVCILAAGILSGVILILVGRNLRLRAIDKPIIVSKGNGGKVQSKPDNQKAGNQTNYDELFASLYAMDVVEEKAEVEPKETAPKTVEVFQEFYGKYDASLTMKNFCAECFVFFEERKMEIGRTGARELLSAFASSRLVLLELRGVEGDNFYLRLGEYFGGGTYFADAAGAENTGEIFYDGEFTRAISHARSNADDIHIVTIKNVSEKTANALRPLLRCAYSQWNVTAEFQYEGKKERLVIPPNVWFVLVPAEEQIHFTDPVFCNTVAVMYLDVVASEGRDFYSSYHQLNFYQFTRMIEKTVQFGSEGSFELDEERCWKKIDKLEKSIGQNMMDNRDCQSVERYAGVYLACDGEQDEALDFAVSAKLILPALCKNDGQEGLFTKIDSIFNESEQTKKVLGTCRNKIGI